nr:tetratricopeptide repeat protein [Helicobacter suis]
MGLGFLYQNGEGVKKDCQKAMQYYKKAGDLGNAEGYYNVAEYLGDYRGDQYECRIKQDVQKAMQYLYKAAGMGLAKAYEYLGTMYRFESPLKKQDYKKAFEYYKKAADMGDTEATTQLAIMYKDGLGVQKDPQKSKEYYEEAGTE